MTLTQGLIFVVTMFILFGGLFYTLWVFRNEQSGGGGRGEYRRFGPGRDDRGRGGRREARRV